MFLHDHNTQTNADTVTFKNILNASLSLQEALDFLEELCSDDESGAPANVQALYIQPPRIEGDLSGEDSGDDDGGLPDNLCPAQLKSGCEIVLENGRRIESLDGEQICLGTEIEDEPVLFDILDDCLPSSSKKICRVNPSKPGVPIPPANKERNFTWPNYEDSRGLSPHELFEKFFNDDLLEHICKCSNLYATHHQKRYEELNVGEPRVFIGILIVTGYNPTRSFRDMWSNEDDLRNGMVFSAMRRNRFEEINYMLHFSSSICKPKDYSDRYDSLWKLRPLTDHIKAKMMENFYPEQNISYDE
ncbi:piggyBac transposable element-derived protein 3-like, partial [Rhagoletis pomonella]|uniref:piggyBac transposable element-derived protein 3-like n=1 Tax=Rhagoletis pomonella TaxID=28610 RepID=UPI0017862820